MSNPLDAAMRFFHEAGNSRDHSELVNRFETAIRPFGFDKFSCAPVAAPDSLKPNILFGRGHAEWDVHYAWRRYMLVDPCVERLLKDFSAFAWSDMNLRDISKVGQQIRGEASDAGATDGIVVPVRTSAGNYLVRITTPETGFNPEMRSTLEALCILFGSLGTSIGKPRPEFSFPSFLTEQEYECLNWVSQGKSDVDIADILSISRSTIHARVESVKRKLGVRTRTQAVLLAKDKGWITCQ